MPDTRVVPGRFSGWLDSMTDPSVMTSVVSMVSVPQAFECHARPIPYASVVPMVLVPQALES